MKITDDRCMGTSLGVRIEFETLHEGVAITIGDDVYRVKQSPGSSGIEVNYTGRRLSAISIIPRASNHIEIHPI